MTRFENVRVFIWEKFGSKIDIANRKEGDSERGGDGWSTELHPQSFGFDLRSYQHATTLLPSFLLAPHYPVTLLLIGSGYFRAKPFPVQILPTSSNLVILHTYLAMKMERTECSETSVYKIRKPENYPEESIQYLEHGESLKSRTESVFIVNFSLTFTHRASSI